MNDAEFCTDAHRQSYGEEQMLAMQRLSDSSPAMQRTQKMAALNAGGAAMTIVGGLCPDLLRAIPGARLPEEDAKPLPAAATVLFRDHDHPFRAGMAFSSRSIRLSLQPARCPERPAAVLGQTYPVRIVVPRELSSRNHQKKSWSAVPVHSMEPIPAVSAQPGANAGRQIEIRLNPLSYRMSVQPVSLPSARSGKQLVAVRALSRVPAPAAGRTNCSRRQEIHWESTPSLGIRLPQSRLAPAANPVPVPEPVENTDVWSALEESPLCALVNATGYTALQASRLSTVPALANPPSRPVPFPAAPAAYTAPAAISVRELPVHSIPVLNELHAVGVPATVPPVSRPAGTDLSPAVSPTRSTLPLATSFRSPTRLPFHVEIRPVAALQPACPALPAKWNSDWQFHLIEHRICKLAATLGTAAMPSGSILALPRQSEQGALPARSARFGAETGVSPWLISPVAEMRPSSRIRSAGAGMAAATGVEYNWQPDASEGPRTADSPQVLRPVLRYRLPRHSLRPASGHRGAERVSMAPPAPARLAWKPVLASSVDLCPPVQWPPEVRLARPGELRKLPVRLFRIAGAFPMARPLGGKPKAYALSLWGGKPAVRPSGLIADDGTPRKRPEAARSFRFDWRNRFSADTFRNAWSKASHLPSDLKWIAMVVPLVLGIWVLSRPSTAEPVHSATRAVREVAPEPAPEEKEPQLAAVKPVTTAPIEIEKLPAEPPAKVEPPPVKKAAAPSSPSAWDAFTARIANRASVNLIEDFKNGLSGWEGRGEWARSWSYDRSGTVRPGHMAVYQPTLNLRDYVMEMKASIEHRSIQWLVRASGPNNYHYFRLNVTPGAPLTRLELERWTVINGRMGRVTRLPLPHGGANQTLYSIRSEVQGDSITTYLQDQVIDTFNDPRLQEGGVGLVGSGDDRPRIYGIRVYHQNDFLGKLCSFFAPPPINNQGSD